MSDFYKTFRNTPMVHVYSNVQLKFITYDSFFERYCITIISVIECTVDMILVPFQYYHVVEVVDIIYRYVKYVLDKIVEQDYTVVYCHYGLRSYNKPRFSWFRNVYSEMDRK